MLEAVNTVAEPFYVLLIAMTSINSTGSTDAHAFGEVKDIARFPCRYRYRGIVTGRMVVGRTFHSRVRRNFDK